MILKMVHQLSILAAVVAVLSPGLSHGEPPSNDRPARRRPLQELRKNLRFESLPDEPGQRRGFAGYKAVLSREYAEKLLQVLKEDVDEKQVGRTLNSWSTDVRTKLLTPVVASNVSKFKKGLEANLGAHGVVITVKGPKPRDLTKADAADGDRTDEAIATLLPARLRGLFAAVNTVPMDWSIAPRTTPDP
jgi:hypothetical protein